MSRKMKKILLGILTILIVLIVILFIKENHIFRFHRGGIFHISPRMIRRYILSYGKYASLVFVIMYSLKPFLLVMPVWIFSVVAGSVFGPWKAFALSMIGCYFSGTIAFMLAKKLGRPFVTKILKGKVMKLDDNIDKHGLVIILLMRLSFIFPYDALSYAAGLTKMKYSEFILGTLIGVAPEMLGYSFIGKGFGGKMSLASFLPVLLVVCIAPIAYFARKKLNKK
ncbi:MULTISPECIES: TVP38/TMEM64 family protein [Clostridium]|uniref:TVP38/TMEM64 family protein n=1 Tax=Clostridium TaxID=1485 RepID=UPI00082607E5|nr:MULTISPECIES: TVP38/TMEM64 family protein [Clostridium]PJI10327.1 TVP38/TMEM64 family protein [Clostridium sp. CT7]